MSRHVDERGVVALEFVLIVPVLLLFLGLAAIGGRLAKADGEIQSAVRAAARAASVQRSDSAAVAAANQAAQADLASAGVTCHDYNLTLVPGGPGGLDQARLTCVVPLAGLEPFGNPSKTLTVSFSSPVDLYRQFGS